MTTTYTCANPDCKMQLLEPKPSNLIREEPKLDDVILCGACGEASVITLEGTKLLGPVEMELLTDEEKRELLFATRAIKRHIRAN